MRDMGAKEGDAEERERGTNHGMFVFLEFSA